MMSNKYKTIASTLIAALALALAFAAHAGADLSGPLSHPGFDPNSTSIYVADASTGRPIASHMPNLQLNPASCAKILTSVAALAKLGPGYTFKTYFYADRKPQHGTIGTLYVKGTGDPSLINEELERIAATFYGMGIRNITGGIVIDNSFFDSFEYPRKIGNAGRAYTAKTSAVSINFNSVGIDVSPGRAGRPGKVELKPPVEIYNLKNKLVTGGKTNISIAMNRGPEGKDILVSGRISPRSGTHTFWRAIPNPVEYGGAVIKHIFGERGIVVTGPTRGGLVPKGAVLLAEEKSRPLVEIVRDMNKLSTNFVAEQIVKHMGGVFKGAPGSTAKGVAVIEDYLASIGIQKGNVVLENGSGLSSISRISAKQLVDVLVAAYRNRAIQYDFMASLSVLGIDGTMKKWKKMEPSLTGIVYAKTGTLDGVSTLAGYVPGPDGQIVAFAIMANGLPKGPWAAKKAQLGVVKSIAGRK
jgi:D-alanyl-D-alanine carboxypeptidase/D-alanyl-D-alanine-endopeptidase (penicillin-binding protein 4)